MQRWRPRRGVDPSAHPLTGKLVVLWALGGANLWEMVGAAVSTTTKSARCLSPVHVQQPSTQDFPKGARKARICSLSEVNFELIQGICTTSAMAGCPDALTELAEASVGAASPRQAQEGPL